MTDESKQDVATAMRQINAAWLERRVDDLGAMVHPEVVMVFPGFSGRVQGRWEFLAGFREFCEGATIHHFEERDQQIDVAGETAVLTFRYEMLYDRSGMRYHATGRDMWVFQDRNGQWVGVWRTMFDVEEISA
jgi:hypothetical protein